MEKTKTFELEFYLLNGGKAREVRTETLTETTEYIQSIQRDGLTLTDPPTEKRSGRITFIPYHSISSIEITEKKAQA